MARLAAKNYRKREDERTERESGIKETKFTVRRSFRSKIGEREKSGAKSRDRRKEQRKDTGTHSRDGKGNGKVHGMHTDIHHTLK